MKHHIWSKPDLHWEGFEPVPYWFHMEKSFALKLTRKSEGQNADQHTTVGDVYALLRDKPLSPESLEGGVLEDRFVTLDDSLTLKIEGPLFNRDVLRTMLTLHSEGINPFSAIWYYFDHDSCRQDPQECYSFFVVANDKITRERVAFFNDLYSGFDPTIFDTHDYKDMTWGDEADWHEADTRYWYRKFYTETRTGQLMALRPDEPQLFFYEETGPDVMGAIGVLNQSLVTIRLLLWALVIVSVINLVVHWR